MTTRKRAAELHKRYGSFDYPIDGFVREFQVVDEADLPPAGKPDLIFPHGFFSFNICCLTPSEIVTVVIELPSAVPVGTQYWKCQNGTWYQIPIGDDDGDNMITIQLTDGGLGDGAGVADGVITDPGGPGNVPPPVGGEVFPVNKLGILAPWIGLALVIALGGGIKAY